MTATAKTWTINDIKTACRVAGSHWFDPDTMRFFKGRVLDTVYQGPGGIFFVSSERHNDHPRRYTVRRFTPPSDIGTEGEFNEMSKARAITAARKAAAGQGGAVVGETTEKYLPVSVLEQFVDDLKQHGSKPRQSQTIADDAQRLMRLAKRHHHYMELLCSDEAFCRQVNEDGEHPDVITTRRTITKIAAAVGAAGVIFSGDPRGCTVKLTFADGFTDDFAKEGYCVPTDK